MKDTKPKKRILVPFGAGKEISKELKTTLPTVSLALSGVRKSALTAKIRELALSKYGGNYSRD